MDVAAFAESASEEPETSPTDSGISRSSAYCYTLVQSLADGIFKQESAPSPASDVVDVLDGDGVTLSGFEIPDMDGLTVTHIRLYRTASGTKTSEFHFLAELEVPVEEYVDTVHDADLSSDVLQTSAWDCIPDDARGLIHTDNGLYACFRGNELLVSEPFISYAFPTAYRLTTEDSIVALGYVDGTIIVLTTGRPYLAAGQEPESLQITHLPIEQACVSARSVGNLPGGVVYASPDGLMLFTSGNQTLLTGQTFTREQWQALQPETLMGTVHDGATWRSSPEPIRAYCSASARKTWCACSCRRAGRCGASTIIPRTIACTSPSTRPKGAPSTSGRRERPCRINGVPSHFSLPRLPARRPCAWKEIKPAKTP